MVEQIVDAGGQRPSYAVAMAGLLERLTWVMAEYVGAADPGSCLT